VLLRQMAPDSTRVRQQGCSQTGAPDSFDLLKASQMYGRLVRLKEQVQLIMCGSFAPARTRDLLRLRGSITALLATPFLRQRRS
jgi:hypothetical protein